MPNFHQRLLAATPHIRATYFLIAVNVLVYAGAVISGVSPLSPEPMQLLALGGNFLPYTAEQPWRLFSATVLHAGLVHLLFNMWALLEMGKIAERFYGSVQFAIIYLLSGIFGSLISLFFTASYAVSVGASGAVYGVAGAIIAALLTKADKLPPATVYRLRMPMLFFIGASLVFGLILSSIDNAAHLGGLAAGFLLAWAMAERFDWSEFRSNGLQRAILAVGAAFTVALALWWLVPLPTA